MTEKFVQVHVVLLVEHEYDPGFGASQRVEGVSYFPSKELAQSFCEKYNEINKPTSRDWFMIQEYEGTKFVSKEKFKANKYRGDLVEMPTWKWKDI